MNTRKHSPKILRSFLVAISISLFVACGIAMFFSRMAPVRAGDPHIFWSIAAGVSLSPNVEDDLVGMAYFVDDKWAAYDWSGYHGSDIFRVPVAEVLAEFDAVVASLDQAVQRGEDSPFLDGYKNWHNNNRPRTSQALLEDIKRTYNLELSEVNSGLLEYRATLEQKFWLRWHGADRYWTNGVFEWTFLTGLAFFTIWPVVFNRSALRRALHVAFLPVLFLLPSYLGYATYSFTSAGPSGGILYPFLLISFPFRSGNAVDNWILERTPQILEPLSTDIGSPTVLSGMGMPGPTCALFTGGAAGTIVFMVLLGFRRRNQRRLQADVVPTMHR